MNNPAATKRRPVFDRPITSMRNFHRLKTSRTSLAIVCLIVAGIIGYVDYVTGYEHSLLLFYFLQTGYQSYACLFENLIVASTNEQRRTSARCSSGGDSIRKSRKWRIVRGD